MRIVPTKIAEIIQQDASLTYRFLRIIGKRAKEDEIAAAATTFRALVLEKQVRLLTVLSALQVGFGSNGST